MSGTTNIPAVCVLLRKGDNLLFVRRANTGFQDGTYCLPAGHVEYGESFRQAAAREALEEVNAKIDIDQLRFVHMQQTYKSDDDIRIHVFFEAEAWDGELRNMELDKHDEMIWFPISDLPYQKLMPLVAQGLKSIREGLTYDEWGWH